LLGRDALPAAARLVGERDQLPGGHVTGSSPLSWLL